MANEAFGPQGYPSSMKAFERFAVNYNSFEIVRQSLYDRAAYAAAGQTQLTFFATPLGQGGKTLSDTNMSLSSQLPTNQAFLCTAISINFLPTTPSVAAQLPAAFGAQSIAQIVNDAYIFNRAGSLRFQIGSKDYLQEAPLMKFPARSNFHVEAGLADTSTAGAALQSRVAYAHSLGAEYDLTPPLTLTSNQNFNVFLTWPEGVQALPSGNPASVFVSLWGFLARRAQ